MSFEDPPPQLSYIKLLIVIFFGVAGGNLLSNFITAGVATYQLAASASKFTQNLKQETQKAKDTASENQAHIQMEQEEKLNRIRQARRDDRTGIKLFQSCSDWTKANDQLHTYTSQTEMEKACSKYENYIQTGILLNN